MFSVPTDAYICRKASQFCVGDAAFIADIASSYYGKEGRILVVLVNKREGTPDKYDVGFGDGPR